MEKHTVVNACIVVWAKPESIYRYVIYLFITVYEAMALDVLGLIYRKHIGFVFNINHKY